MLKKSLVETTLEEWDDTFAINLKGPWFCSIKAAGLMSKGGVIINITDAGTSKTWINYQTYILSKAGLELLTRLLARSLAPNIRVNAIAPGLILRPSLMDQGEWDGLIKKLPLRKSGTSRQIVEAVVFLVKNEYITGQTLVVDGGYQLI